MVRILQSLLESNYDDWKTTFKRSQLRVLSQDRKLIKFVPNGVIVRIRRLMSRKIPENSIGKSNDGLGPIFKSVLHKNQNWSYPNLIAKPIKISSIEMRSKYVGKISVLGFMQLIFFDLPIEVLPGVLSQLPGLPPNFM